MPGQPISAKRTNRHTHDEDILASVNEVAECVSQHTPEHGGVDRGVCGQDGGVTPPTTPPPP